jgi:hypothetical protein
MVKGGERMMGKNSYIGNKKVVYYEDEVVGEYSYIDGEWMFVRSQV